MTEPARFERRSRVWVKGQFCNLTVRKSLCSYRRDTRRSQAPI